MPAEPIYEHQSGTESVSGRRAAPDFRAFLEDLLNAAQDPSTTSPWELRRIRYINIVLLALVGIASPYIWVYQVMGLPYAPISVAVSVTTAIVTIAVLRKTGNIDLCGNLATLTTYFPIVVSLYELGGMYTSAFSWCVVLPMLSGLLVGLRGCIVWSGIAFLTLIGFWAAHLLNVIPPPLPEPLYFYQSIATDSGALLTACIICVGFLLQTQESETRAQKTIASLDDEVAVRRKAETEARDALEVRSRFLAMMSHEIRTPLNGMLGMGRLLHETPLTDDQHDLLQTSLGAGETLLSVLNDILDFSKLDADSMSVEQIPTPLHRLVQEMVALYAASAEEKALNLELNCEPGLPEWIETDRTRLRQILGNLLSNAVKFTEHGSITVSVCELNGKELEFAVRDNGIGISETAQLTLFQPFIQAESTTTRRYGGTGLGLAISRQLIELMGGEMRLESTPGAGSTFRFSIPLRHSAAPREDSVAKSRETIVPLRILVAEDNAINQKLIRLFLERSSHQVTLVTNGAEAVEKALKEPWDLVFMDMQMPVMDGLEATRRIRDNIGTALPIVALTANAMSEDRARCKEAGMSDFLAKPFKFDEFDDLLERWNPASMNS